MPPTNREASYLWNMLQAAHRIQEFTAGLSYEDYLESVLIQSAVERQLEIMGEAARRLSEAFFQEHPNILWREIIAIRQAISYEYEKIHQKRLWRTITLSIPVLISQLKSLISTLPPEIE